VPLELVTVVSGLVGLAIGSFLNVVIWRIPRGESIVSPPSACPSCHAKIRSRDNVPVLSWLILRGKCRDCSTRISARYPLVEAGTAALFVVLALRIGPEPELPAFLYLGAVGVALALIDLDHQRLPDSLTLPSYAVALVLLGGAALADGDSEPFLRAVIGGVALFAVYFAIWFAYPKGMGFGDVKLSGLLGAYLGWVAYGALVTGAFLGFLIGGVFSIGLVLLTDAGRKSKVPFGPFMLLGALIGILTGSSLVDAYLSATVG
jgi:leader peptidase (prepilin peptidase)/N-methyltransferase